VTAPTLDDDGMKELAIAILQQAASDLRGANATRRRNATAFIRRTDDFAYWCERAGLDVEAAREYLGIRDAA
jgi:hypothetical protein